MGKFSWLLYFCLTYYLTSFNASVAQVIEDQTTPTQIKGDCQTSCRIEGGTNAGQNLFHSFQEFNVKSEAKVIFHDPGVSNIFSRITGQNPSSIFGVLGVKGGDANLFLINPHGFIFGNNARLDVNGSFVATTADGIKFGKLGSFNSVPTENENLTLLNINPSAFFFNQLAESSSLPSQIEVQPGAVLKVKPQENIVLLGSTRNNSPETTATLTIDGGKIETVGGNIQLGAVKVTNSPVEVAIDPNFQLFYPANPKGDISLTNGSRIIVNGYLPPKNQDKEQEISSGNITITGGKILLANDTHLRALTPGNLDGGKVHIVGKELEINNGSNIVTLTSGSGKGADIDLNISNSLNIIGSDTVSLDTTITSIFQQSFQLSEDFSGVYSVTQGRGKAGDIEINTQKFSLENQATVFAPTFASGNSGNIMLNAQKVLIDDSAFLSFGSIESQGSVGDMTINTEQLLVQNGGLISTGTLGQGKGGDILINSSESVTLAKTPPGVRLPTGIYTNSIFNQAPAGNITLNSPKLTIAGGAWLTSGSGLIITPDIFIPLGGKSGDITINSQKIRIAGISPDGLFTSRIFNDNAGRETAGNIYINTQILDILDNGSISTTSLGLGTGGNIFIEATESVNLVGNGFNQLQGIIDNILKTGNLEQIFFPGGIVTGSFQTGNSGHLTINTGQLNLTKGMAISTLSLGNGDSGNISIHTNEGINLSSSVINTSTAGEGIGGSIKLTTPELHIENGGSLTTVTFGSGDAGDVEILANNKVQISDLPRNSLSITGIATNTLGDSGNAGDVKIMTQSLILENGGTIIAETEESALPNSENPPGKGGNIFIHATDSIKLSGSTFSQIFGFVSSGLSTSTDSSASAGNLEIQTQELIVENGALIEVSSKGTGAAGDLKILAENIWLREQGNLSANTDSGRGGNIKLTALDSIYLDNSFISAKAFGIGRGGNIDINSQNLIVDRQSEITAEAIVGQGGNINVNSLILLLSTDSMITATSQLGIDGVININSLNPDQTIGAEKLAQSLLSTEDEVQSRCQSGENYTQATFIITGKGGLPNNPYQLPKRADLLLDLEDETELWEVHNSSSLPHSQLSSQWIEARGWYVNQAGKTILTSTNPPYPSFSLAPVSSCPKKMPYSYNPNK